MNGQYGYQYVCLSDDNSVLHYSYIYPSLCEALCAASNSDTTGTLDFIIGPYAIYNSSGVRCAPAKAEYFYGRLGSLRGSYAATYPMMYVYDRCPLKMAADGCEDGPVQLVGKEYRHLTEAINGLRGLHYETHLDGPVFKAILNNGTVYDRHGRVAKTELADSVMGVRFHPSGAERCPQCSCYCR